MELGELAIIIIIIVVLVLVIAITIKEYYEYLSIEIIGGGYVSTSHSLLSTHDNIRDEEISKIHDMWKSSADKILNMYKSMDTSQIKLAQAKITPSGKLVAVSERLNPPYYGYIAIVRKKDKLQPGEIVDICFSLSIKEFAFVIVDIDGSASIWYLDNLQENPFVNKTRDEIIDYIHTARLDEISGLNVIGNSAIDEKRLLREMPGSRFRYLSSMNEGDIMNLDWSEVLAKSPEWTSKQTEVGGNLDIVDGKVKIVNVDSGLIGSVSPSITHNIVFHSHPHTMLLPEPPSVTDLYHSYMGGKEKTIAWDVVIAQEGIYIYRPSKMLCELSPDVVESKLSGLTTGCYKMRPLDCIKIVINRIRDMGFIIYLIPNEKYKLAAENQPVMHYWNRINNENFIGNISLLSKFTADDFRQMDWSEIDTHLKSSTDDRFAAVDVSEEKGKLTLKISGPAGMRPLDIHSTIGQAPGREPGTIDIINHYNLDAITSHELLHIIKSYGYVSHVIILTPRRKIIIRPRHMSPKLITDGKKYTPEELTKLGFQVLII